MRWPLLLMLPLLLLPAQAQQVRVGPAIQRIDIFEHGLYEADTISKNKDPNDPTGYSETQSNVRNIGVTDKVPGELETEFGIRYGVDGEPDGVLVPVTLIVHFPEPGIRNPQTGKTVRTVQRTNSVPIGGDDFRGYSFDYPWEIVPGVWTFELWYGGRKMAEQKFTVVK